MGKTKKGKRSGKDDDIESDNDIPEQSLGEIVKSKSKTKDRKKKKGDDGDVDELMNELAELKVDKSKGKKGKKSKKFDDDSDDDDNLSSLKLQKGKKINDDDDDGNNSGSNSEIEIKSKGKGKKNQGKKGFSALEMNSDVESDNEVLPKAKSKGKKKKGKKTDDFGDDNDDENDHDNFSTKIDVKNKTNVKKNKKKNDEESDNDIPKSKGKTKKGKKISISENEDDDDDDDININILPSKPSKAKAKTIKSGFYILDGEGDDNDDDDEDDNNDDDDDELLSSEDQSKKLRNEEKPKGKSQQQSQKNQEPQNKKGKKGKKKQDSDDEIEKALAELEMEYSGKKIDSKSEQITAEIIPTDEISTKKTKEKIDEPKVGRTKELNKEEGNEVDGEGGGTMKSAAQKKKEKKEREKQKKMAQKKVEMGKKLENLETPHEGSVEKQSIVLEKAVEVIDAEEDTEEGKKKKKKGVKEDPKDKGKGPGKKILAAMQEALKKAKEDEERAKFEEEERIRQEELREKARLEQLQLEQERKEKKKLKEKQRKERLKAEGKLLTTKQKQDRARAQAMLEALKAQGLEIPDVGEKKQRQRPSLGTRIRPNKIKQQTSQEEKEEIKDQAQVEIVEQQQEKVDDNERKSSIVEVTMEEVMEEVKDSWDADSTEDEYDNIKSDEIKEKDSINHSKMEQRKKSKVNIEVKKKIEVVESSASDSESGSGDGSESDSDDDSDDDNDDNNSIEDKLTDAEKKRERARLRIQNRRVEAEKKKSLNNLRAAVVCVLGHVDTGKTKILDKLRRTNVQDGEAGGITQQIGATNVPIEAIQESTKHVKGFADKLFKIPGLLIIDTPGHESFSNLRNRGSSLCDIAVLVVDIMHGLEPQTLESIGLLKAKKCPFVVALNKIDRLYDWQTMNRKDIHDIIKTQAPNTLREFEKRSKDVIVQFAEQGLNAALFYENPDPRSYVSLVPTSAITGEGMGNLLALIVDACQGPLAKRLMFSEELQATVLEVKALPGLGTTIDCILVNGTLREGETMIVAGTDGPIVTQIRSLLMPQPLKELRVKNAYIEYREIKAAQGVKIAAKDLDKAIAGLNLQIAQKPDEVDLLREEIARELSKALGNIKLAERGVFVQASTLGALEALLDFLRSSKIPYAGIRIGPVVKKDVMKASIMLEHDSQYATILAFDVKIERDAQDLADSLGVKIFQADIIYHLFDKFTAYRDELRQRKRDEHKHIAVFPCKLKILPQFIFNSRDPIVMGVMVEAGIVKEGTPVCVPSKDFIDLGVVTSIEYNHKAVESARKGQEVCVKIEPIPSEAPKMYGRHFDEKDFITSKISRQSIDACKDYFRDDLLKTDWQLMVELKKLFQIL